MNAGRPEPPHSLDAELALLGTLLLRPATCDDPIFDLVDASDFYSPTNAGTFRAIERLVENGRTPDPVLVADELAGVAGSRDAALRQVTTVLAHTGVPNRGVEYAELVRRKARLRRAQQIGARLTEISDTDNDAVVQSLERLLGELRADIGPARRFAGKYLDGAEILGVPPPDPLVGKWFNLDSLAAIYGPPKAGKSFLAIDLAMSVALGRSWFGHTVTRVPVLYVVAEGPASYSRRVHAWAVDRHLSDDCAELNGWISWLIARPQLSNPADMAEISAAAVDMGAKLIVFDTLARSAVGVDENSSKEMGLVVDGLDTLREETGACVVAVHHAGKDTAKGLRGSNALLAGMSTSVSVIGSDGRITVRCEDQRDGEAPEPLHLRLMRRADSVVLVDRMFGGDEQSGEEMPESAWKALEALRSIDFVEGVTVSEWVVAAADRGVSRSRLYAARKRLLETGLVRLVGRGRLTAADPD